MLTRQIIAQDMGLNPDDFAEIDPADFEAAPWPNGYKDFEYPCVPCLLCGHALRYAAGYLHKPSGELFYVGQDCEKYIDSENKGEMEFRKLRVAAKNREMEAAKLAEWTKRNDTFRATDPEVASFLDNMDPEEEGFDFLVSMFEAYNKYGSLTERQLEAVQKILAKRDEWNRKMAERANAPVPEVDAPEGRQSVEGTVVSMKFYEGDYYNTGSWKMLVILDDGNKVWGTCPASIESGIDFNNLRERLASGEYKPRVKFSANFIHKDGDSHFAYFKRPTKGEVL